MLSAEASRSELFEAYGSVTEWNGKAYVRLEPEEAEAAAAAMPPGTEKAQIVRIEGKDWLVAGWLREGQEQAAITEEGDSLRFGRQARP